MVCELKKKKVEWHIITYEYYSTDNPLDIGIVKVDIKARKWYFEKKTRTESDVVGYEVSRRINRMFKENNYPEFAYECE